MVSIGLLTLTVNLPLERLLLILKAFKLAPLEPELFKERGHIRIIQLALIFKIPVAEDPVLEKTNRNILLLYPFAVDQHRRALFHDDVIEETVKVCRVNASFGPPDYHVDGFLYFLDWGCSILNHVGENLRETLPGEIRIHLEAKRL